MLDTDSPEAFCIIANASTTGYQFIPELISLHRQGSFPIDKITKVYPITDLGKALLAMKNGTVCRTQPPNYAYWANN